MSAYSTFFVCTPDELTAGFPEWRPPLQAPVRRQFVDPWTKEVVTVETVEPEWPDEASAQPFVPTFDVMPMQGNYQDYLEGRLPPVVRDRPHWCSKGLTQIQLDPLGEACGLGRVLKSALFCQPDLSSQLLQLHAGLVEILSSIEGRTLKKCAKRWAKLMSHRNHTHSMTGVRMREGWKRDHAMAILNPLQELAIRCDNGKAVYLLIEM